MTYICGKWFKYLRNGYNVGNDLEMWKMAKMYVGNDVSI